MGLKPNGCKPGHEQHEQFWSRIKQRMYVQYDYRNSRGELFSCLAENLVQARTRKDKWASVHGQ